MTEFDMRKLTGGRPIQLEPRQIFALAWAGAGVIVVLWGLFTSFYTVEASEEAVILRFGRFHTIDGPGFHGKLPFGIDRVLKGEVTTVHREEFGYRTLASGVQSRFDYTSRRAIAEATMLTGDLNMALVNWEVRYKIRDLRNYLFEIRNPRETLRDVSQAVMRTEIGNRSVDEVLTLDRTDIEDAVAEKMQALLGPEGFQSGIQIVQVNLKRVAPPDPVQDAFDAVNQAIQIRDRIINEAEGERNKNIPAARGDKERVVKEAEGYKIGRVNRAEGDTKAFISVLEEYKKAEEVTRRRLYLEAMEQLLPRVGEITIIDSDEAGVLKLLDLKKGKDQ